MKYYLISNKPDDFNNCRQAVFYGKEKDIKRYVYEYEEIPEEHYHILKIYLEDLTDKDYEDFGYTLKEYLSEW